MARDLKSGLKTMKSLLSRTRNSTYRELAKSSNVSNDTRALGKEVRQ